MRKPSSLSPKTNLRCLSPLRPGNALFEALQTRTISGEALSADELNWISMYRTSAERAGFEAMNQLYAVNQ